MALRSGRDNGRSNDIKAAASALGGDKGKSKGGKMPLRGIHIRPGHKGGFIATHEGGEENGEEYSGSKMYPLSDIKALHSHIDEHLGDAKTPSHGKSDKEGMEELD